MKDWIVNVPDFPKKGIMFRDISPLLASSERFEQAISEIGKKVAMAQADYIAGIESRGFILASAIAVKFGKGFLPIRKQGKLPPPVEFHAYTLEYGEGTLEMKKGKGRVIVIDDVLATGGTLDAAIKLCAKAGFDVKDAAVLIDLKYLNSYKWNGKDFVHSLVQYEK